MASFDLENPAFTAYLVASALMVLKIMGQGWMTVYRMTRSQEGLASPEDLRPGPYNRKPDPSQLQPSDYVERSRRIHRNDLENIPAFFAAGLLFVAVAPPLLLVQILMYGFALARVLHTIAYATAQRHEIRSIPYTIGSLIVIFMALWVLGAVLL
ncbi:MAG: MAPEG family protein [Flavobacteriaceae bacterium]